MPKLRIYVIYFSLIVILYVWENLIIGNLEAKKGRNYGKIILPKVIKNILFPIVYVKRFTYVLILYQGFNFLMFSFMILIGIFADTMTTIEIFWLYLWFQKFYWLWGPILLVASVGFREKRWILRFNRNRKNNVDDLHDILKDMGVQTIETDDVTAFYVEPLTDVKGCVFLINVSVNGISTAKIPENDYEDILENMVGRGYVLIYVPFDTSEDKESYTKKFETILGFFYKKYTLNKPSVFLMGRVILDMPIMSAFFRDWECVSGMIWISLEREKRLTKYLEKYVKDDGDSIMMKRQKDIYILCIYESDGIKNLNIWLAEERQTTVLVG